MTMTKKNNKSSSFLDTVIEAKLATIKEGILPLPIARKLGVRSQPPTTQLKETYVLCERGGANLQRQANCQYRNIVYQYRPQFFQTVTNAEKKSITLQAQQEVKDAGLELVREFRVGGGDPAVLGVVDYYPFLHGGGYYYFLDDKRVYSKIIQLIRDGNPDVINNRAKNKNNKNSSSSSSKLSLVKILSHKKKKETKHKAPPSPDNKSKSKKMQSRISIHNKSRNSKAMKDMRTAPTSPIAGCSLLGNKDVLKITPVSPSPIPPKKVVPVEGPMGMISPLEGKQPPQFPLAATATAATTTTTPEDEREMWIFWNLLSDKEHREIARRHGHPTIGDYEKQLRFQISKTTTTMDEDYSFGAVAALPAITSAVVPPSAAAAAAAVVPKNQFATSPQASSTAQDIDVSELDNIPLEDLSTSDFLEGLDDLDTLLDFTMEEGDEEFQDGNKKPTTPATSSIMVEESNDPPFRGVSCSCSCSSACFCSSAALQHLKALDGDSGCQKRKTFYPVWSTSNTTEWTMAPLPFEEAAIIFPPDEMVVEDYDFSGRDAPMDDEKFVQGLLVA